MNPSAATVNLGAVLRTAARHRGSSPAYIDRGRTWSYASMDDHVDHLACGLLSMGLRPGDCIGLLGLNQIEWLQVFLAATRVGVCVVALSVRHRDHDLAQMLDDSRACGIVTVRGIGDGVDFIAMVQSIQARIPRLRHIVVMGDDGGDMPDVARLMATPVDGPVLARAEAAVTPDAPAMVIFTSGTTGRPKGAVLTHASMLAAARAQVAHTRLDPQDMLQVAMPFNHVGGITCCVLAMLLAGGCCELVPAFKAEVVLEMMDQHCPTIIVGVPTMMTLLLMSLDKRAVDLSAVRLVITGGSNVDPTLLERLQAMMPQATLMNLYGLSEASGALVMSPWSASRDALLHAIGRPLGDAQLKVIGADGEPVPSGDIGELCFRGAGVIGGYLGAGDAVHAFSADGWLHTGDLGLVGPDGLIYLKGRAKEMYVQGGFNVYPVEVENFIAQHPAVLQVAGIGVPDPVLGEVGRFYVVLRPGSVLTGDDIRAYCAAHLADYKVPRQIVLCEQLPMTPAGKVHKAALRQLSQPV